MEESDTYMLSNREKNNLFRILGAPMIILSDLYTYYVKVKVGLVGNALGEVRFNNAYFYV